ncbi:putative multiple-sugar transport system permease YteP [Paenibacillus allorhizoplanae]|uniref:Multiple-sugar transport system permease YteP n=2 Tax=Paenibacillus allorhizoplanae TaxID=2905648 RepID=A0ABN8GWF3_9BACL|nr:ABC transporter permease subunit [Paenibacillus allorhizoplanae]CAH1220397.1 putative multiple-sugar transport system permease YteP [Paenibacillus allorhizoplanae]
MNRMKWKAQMPLHLMLIPGLIAILIFQYYPMAGIVIAFQKYMPTQGLFHSKWIGLDNFRYVMELPDFYRVLWNTIYIALMKIIVGLIVPIVIAILLNEVRKNAVKRIVQTLVYLPHFLSWVILSGILLDVLSPKEGIVNSGLRALGMQSIFFLGDNHWFPITLVLTNEWKEFGFSTIVYLAAILGINPALYEAATMDGANRWKQTLHITLPGMAPIIVLLATLSIGNVLNAGFEQVFNLYSPIVYESGDIIDTFVYRIGMIDAQYGVATAVGLFKSLVSLILIALSYTMAYRFANYRIF